MEKTLEEKYNESVESEIKNEPKNKYNTENRLKFNNNPYQYQLDVLTERWYEALSEFQTAKMDFEAEDKSFERIKILLKDIIPDIMKLRELCTIQISKEKEDLSKEKDKKKPKKRIISAEDFAK